LFAPVRNEELFPTKLTLLFGYVADEKKVFQRNKAVKFSFSDIHSPVHVEDEQRFSKANEIRSFHFLDTRQSNEPVQLLLEMSSFSLIKEILKNILYY